jgi:hypothetical protein
VEAALTQGFALAGAWLQLGVLLALLAFFVLRRGPR